MDILQTLLEVDHIVDALQGFARPLAEGRLVVSNLLYVGIDPVKTTGSIVGIEALCLRATKVNDDPVVITVSIDKEATKVEEKIRTVTCSCKSGASKEHVCKHAMATLLHLEK